MRYRERELHSEGSAVWRNTRPSVGDRGQVPYVELLLNAVVSQVREDRTPPRGREKVRNRSGQQDEYDPVKIWQTAGVKLCK